MLCGSPAMLADTRAVLEKLGVGEGNMSRPGHCVIERAFVDKSCAARPAHAGVVRDVATVDPRPIGPCIGTP
jgi:hypothetical protein